MQHSLVNLQPLDYLTVKSTIGYYKVVKIANNLGLSSPRGRCPIQAGTEEKISQAPEPFHVIAGGWAGSRARQAERYAKEGLSTVADAPVLESIHMEPNVFPAERLAR